MKQDLRKTAQNSGSGLRAQGSGRSKVQLVKVPNSEVHQDRWSGFTVSLLLILVIGIVLAMIPFHALLTVWLSSSIGHYTALRLWKEVLLLGLMAGGAAMVWRDAALRNQVARSWLNRLIVGYIGLLAIAGLIGYFAHTVTLKALGYGVIVDSRFLLFYLVVTIIASRNQWIQDNWAPLALIPAAIVVLFGLLQYFVLPYDVMRHFGYSASTIFPYETINHNIHYIRIMSTLRGANPLGAYLILVILLVGSLWLRRRRLWKLLLALAAAVALLLTFSRSAWIGLVLAAVVLLWSALKTKRSKEIAVGASLIGVILLAIVAALLLHHSDALQNAVLHTSDHSTVAVSSNQGHESALKNGLKDVLHQPQGRGTGTAGPASVYNRGKVRIAENYFVQVAQETGILGLVVFVMIQILLGRELWRRRDQPLALGLFAALIGLSFVNLLSHAWADDALAYTFWGLAGIAIAQPHIGNKKAPETAND